MFVSLKDVCPVQGFIQAFWLTPFEFLELDIKHRGIVSRLFGALLYDFVCSWYFFLFEVMHGITSGCGTCCICHVTISIFKMSGLILFIVF